MEIKKIQEILEASVISGEGILESKIEHIYASDLMSDVLAFGKADSILLTGLATQQAVISAHMAEFKGVVFIRGKIPRDGSKDFAANHQLVLLSTNFDMYDACIKLENSKTEKPSPSQKLIEPKKSEEILLSRILKLMALILQAREAFQQKLNQY